MTDITNGKYVLLKESLEAIKDGDINILSLFGGPGCGKTVTTLKYLKEQEINYAYINSYATPLSFYELLYNNRNKDVIVFDDVFNIGNPLILSMLKSACWTSDGDKIVSYYSTSGKMDLRKLPESFKFNARVILIFNQPIPGYEPITNRGITINFTFTFEEKLKIFEEIKDEAGIEQEILDYVKIYCNEATKNLSIRTLVILSQLKRSSKDYKRFAEENLSIDKDKEAILTMTAKEWTDETGRHVATYYRKKRRYGL